MPRLPLTAQDVHSEHGAASARQTQAHSSCKTHACTHYRHPTVAPATVPGTWKSSSTTPLSSNCTWAKSKGTKHCHFREAQAQGSPAHTDNETSFTTESTVFASFGHLCPRLWLFPSVPHDISLSAQGWRDARQRGRLSVLTAPESCSEAPQLTLTSAGPLLPCALCMPVTYFKVILIYAC